MWPNTGRKRLIERSRYAQARVSGDLGKDCELCDFTDPWEKAD